MSEKLRRCKDNKDLTRHLQPCETEQDGTRNDKLNTFAVIHKIDHD